ncbi:MAG: hypothetical protein JST43_06725 [Bacteroidetes bacterium]|nr:hypothetical protein [Bacteroidota bacterium]MBS1539615.1 hypothetical protein [Bacteroidota bacterium]
MFSFFSYAQEPPPDPLRTKLNTVFANISRTPITTGYLSDYATPLLPLENFNGILTENNRTTLNGWRMLYATWFTSYIAGTTNPNTGLTAVNSAIASAQNSNGGSVVIPMLHINYNSLRSDAVTANLLRVNNNQLFDVAGRTQSPYNQKVLFAAAPAVNYDDDGLVSFVLQQNLFWSNFGFINALAIDFGEGGGYVGVVGVCL